MLFKKKTIILLVLLVSFYNSIAQDNLLLKSQVVQEGTEHGVEGVTVESPLNGLNATTDEKGFFTFKKELPEGSHIIVITKEGYNTEEIVVEKEKGVKIELSEIEVSHTKKEAKRLAKIQKEEEKKLGQASKNESKKLKDLKKQLREQEKEKAKEEEKQRKLEAEQERLEGERERIEAELQERENSSVSSEPVPEPEEDIITANQLKYAENLNVNISEVSNKELYDFIDEWMGTPYLMGGETSTAIDCSSFSQRLFIKSYDIYLERTAQKQFDSEHTELFKNKKYLSEGDLIFFGKDPFNISHVGVYLHNNKFVHATANTREGASGVKISDLSLRFWTDLYVSAGRRKIKK